MKVSATLLFSPGLVPSSLTVYSAHLEVTQSTKPPATEGSASVTLKAPAFQLDTLTPVPL